MALPAADIYVYHGGDNTTGTSWATAKTSITEAAVLALAAGSVVWVASDHSETSGASNLNFAFSNATLLDPILLFSVNRTTDTYERATAAQFNTSNDYDIYLSECIRAKGLFIASIDNIFIYKIQEFKMYFEDCEFNATDYIEFVDPTYQLVEFVDCDITCDYISLTDRPNAVFKGGSISASHTGGVFNCSNSMGDSALKVIGVDLSAYAYPLLNDADVRRTDFVFQHCLLNASWSATGAAVNDPGTTVSIEYCKSGTLSAPAPPLNYFASMWGTVEHETTTVRTGGASDKTTPFSWKLISNASCDDALELALVTPELCTWVEAGDYNVRIYFAGSTQLQDDEIWIEVISPSSNASPTAQHERATTFYDYGTAANVATDSDSAWGGSPTYKQYMEVNISPDIAGLVRVRVYVAKPSTTVYVDPFVHIITAVA